MVFFNGNVSGTQKANVVKTNYAVDTDKAVFSEQIKQPLLHFGEKGVEVLAQNPQGVYSAQDVQAVYNKTIASATTDIMKDLGYNYKVGAAQVASVVNGINTVVAPGMQLAENGAVALGIQDPKGPFAELFTA